MKSLSTLALLATILFLSSSCLDSELKGSSSKSDCEDTNCIDYSSQSAAQQDYEWNPECRGDLDADNDGIACEENNWTDYYNSLNTNSGGGTNGCPSTSNCGCSGKNKAPCEADPCCKWVVGDGCECS